MEDKGEEGIMHLEEERYYVGNAMLEYGGSFCKKLSPLVFSADQINLKKIKSTWNEYWEKYLEIGIKKYNHF